MNTGTMPPTPTTMAVCSCVCYLCGRGHIEDVYDISWTNDGNSMVSGSVDNTAIMWDVNKGGPYAPVCFSIHVEYDIYGYKCLFSVALFAV